MKVNQIRFWSCPKCNATFQTQSQAEVCAASHIEAKSLHIIEELAVDGHIYQTGATMPTKLKISNKQGQSGEYILVGAKQKRKTIRVRGI